MSKLVKDDEIINKLNNIVKSMSLTWDEKATELIQRFVDEQITLTITKEGEQYIVTGVRANRTQEAGSAQSDDLVVALMLLAGMQPSPSDRQDYDPGEE